jgi:putative ABC transport system permease protein
VNAWRPLLRLAWRDVRRRPLRTTLVALLIAVPVMMITAGNITMAVLADDATAELQMGRAAARVEVYGDAEVADRFTDDEVVVERRVAAIATDPDTADADLVVVGAIAGDVFSPTLEGVYGQVSGRVPAAGEITVSSRLRRDTGIGIGDVVYVGPERAPRTVVGVHEHRAALADTTIAVTSTGAGGALGTLERTDIYVDDADGAFEEVTAVGVGLGVSGYGFILREYVVTDVPVGVRFAVQMGTAAFLLVLALLISAAFASGARRQLREVGLIAANGADPRQVRRAFALQGTITALVGLALGWLASLLAVLVLRDPIDRLVGERIPYRIAPLDLVVSAALVVGAGTLAAWWPARSVARTPLLSALAGRRPSRPASPGLPIAGVALGLLGLGLLMSGLSDSGGGTTGSGNLVIAAIVVLIVSVAIVSSWLVSAAGRLLGRFGGVARVTGRGLDRQRTRTGPLVASIAATATLGVLGVVVQHTEASNRTDEEQYPSSGSLTWGSEADVDAVAEMISRVRPQLASPSPTSTPGAAPGFPYAWAVDFSDVRIGDEWVQMVDERAWTGDPAIGDLLRAGMVVRPDLGLATATVPPPYDDVASATEVSGDRVTLSVLDGQGDRTTAEFPVATAGVDGWTVGVRTLAAAGLVEEWTASLNLDSPPPGSAAAADIDELARSTQRDAELARALGGPVSSPVVYSYGDDPADANLYRTGAILVGAATALLALTAMAIGLGLARIEQRDDELLLTALGAAPGFRRRAGALEAATIAGLAMVIAVPLGSVLAFAIRSEISLQPVDVPWLALAGFTVGLPVLAALLFGITRRTPSVLHLDRS